jgi:hypothetical protein
MLEDRKMYWNFRDDVDDERDEYGDEYEYDDDEVRKPQPRMQLMMLVMLT